MSLRVLNQTYVLVIFSSFSCRTHEGRRCACCACNWWYLLLHVAGGCWWKHDMFKELVRRQETGADPEVRLELVLQGVMLRNCLIYCTLWVAALELCMVCLAPLMLVAAASCQLRTSFSRYAYIRCTMATQASMVLWWWIVAVVVFFCGLPGGAESYWLTTHDLAGRTQLPGA
jgi:hypothetical protein